MIKIAMSLFRRLSMCSLVFSPVLCRLTLRTLPLAFPSFHTPSAHHSLCAQSRSFRLVSPSDYQVFPALAWQKHGAESRLHSA